MPSLLTNQQKLDIRLAIKSVTDTFFVTPITYRLAQDSIDRFNEDRPDMVYQNYALLGMVEFPKDKVEQTVQGALNNADVDVSFNLEDLQTAGLIDGQFKFLGNPAKDYMTINGLTYKLSYLKYDGPLDQKNCLVIIGGDLQENAS